MMERRERKRKKKREERRGGDREAEEGIEREGEKTSINNMCSLSRCRTTGSTQRVRHVVALASLLSEVHGLGNPEETKARSQAKARLIPLRQGD